MWELYIRQKKEEWKQQEEEMGKMCFRCLSVWPLAKKSWMRCKDRVWTIKCRKWWSSSFRLTSVSSFIIHKTKRKLCTCNPYLLTACQPSFSVFFLHCFLTNPVIQMKHTLIFLCPCREPLSATPGACEATHILPAAQHGDLALSHFLWKTTASGYQGCQQGARGMALAMVLLAAAAAEVGETCFAYIFCLALCTSWLRDAVPPYCYCQSKLNTVCVHI